MMQYALKNSDQERIRFDLKAFFIIFLLTLFCHVSAYTNTYLGHDMSLFWNKSIFWDIVTGRYLGFIPKALHGFLQTPWLIGCISSFFLAAAVMGLLKLFRIRSLLVAVVLGLCTAAWPSYIAAHGYLYMLTQFSFALLTSVWAVSFLDWKRKLPGTILCIALMIVSLANYQSYIGISVGLILIRIIVKCCQKEENSGVFRYAVRGLVSVTVSLLLYYLFWQLIMKHFQLEPTSYQEMDMPMTEMIRFMAASTGLVYSHVFRWFTAADGPSYVPWILRILTAVLFLSEAALAVWKIVHDKERGLPVRLLLVLVSLLLLPFAMNLSQFLSHGQDVTSLMECAYILPVYFLIVLIYINRTEPEKQSLPGKIERFAAAVLCAGIITNGFYGANVTYLKQQVNFYRAETELSQVLARLSAEEGYVSATPVAIILEESAPESFDGFEWCDDLTGATDSAITYEGALYAQLWQMRPGITLESAENYVGLEEVWDLQAYPDNHCLTWIDGVIVIKIMQ